MLVLTRKTGQSIVIGDGVEIFVLQVKGSGDQAQVRIGIAAPAGVRVLRREVFDSVAAENRLASDACDVSLERLGEIAGRK